jgi:catechol 2,3-dioxygenase-like lactoylglutathione lyase family enzyme
MASTIVRVADLDASVAWIRDKLGIEPLHVGADGEHPIAAYAIAGMVMSLWQLPAGVRHDRASDDTSSYVVIVVDDDPADVRTELERRNVEVGALRESANASFFWFYDPDGNRFEIARPTTPEMRAARDAARGATQPASAPS